ncbi:hypothetical protein GWK47_036376 [Chionoecetes opilio]|uniref:Uncharacterized protein n=1 Tax=Chionoecetes opilio TaxID=41210 RepID=A0A8J5D1V1_CHIOP|nr:hypothetical protein GWK47_036376 [Chionoecetes opilio]
MDPVSILDQMTELIGELREKNDGIQIYISQLAPTIISEEFQARIADCNEHLNQWWESNRDAHGTQMLTEGRTRHHGYLLLITLLCAHHPLRQHMLRPLPLTSLYGTASTKLLGGSGASRVRLLTIRGSEAPKQHGGRLAVMTEISIGSDDISLQFLRDGLGVIISHLTCNL